jgi:sugar (pentulose or hexulose) kinase
VSLIGLDLGTTYIKAGVLDMDALTISHVQRVPFPAPLPGLPPLRREFDPQQVMTAVRSVLAAVAPYADGVEGILLCTQMHGVVMTTQGGEPRSTLTTWQDQRVLEPHPSGAGSHFDVMMARLTPDDIRALGNETRPGLPIGLFFWLAEQGHAPDPSLTPASLADFVVANLCGARPQTDITNAMAHGLLDVETLRWHDDVIDQLHLGGVRLPEIVPHGAVTGWLELGGRRVPCYTPVGDYQCAILGALLQADELSLNISTGSQVSLLREAAEFGDYQTRPFFDGRYAITVTHIPAGRALNALVRLFSELATAQGIALDDPWEYIIEAAASAHTPRMRAKLAFFASACGDEGELTHLVEDELTVGYLFRAAFESMAHSYHRFAHQLAPEATWRRLVFSGGLAQKTALLRTIICQHFDCEDRLSPAQEDTLLGLTVLGMAFTGRASSIAEATAHVSDAYKLGAVVF